MEIATHLLLMAAVNVGNVELSVGGGRDDDVRYCFIDLLYMVSIKESNTLLYLYCHTRNAYLK